MIPVPIKEYIMPSLSRLCKALTPLSITSFLALFLVVTLPTQNAARPHCHSFDHSCTTGGIPTSADLTDGVTRTWAEAATAPERP
jgi:hypothetical protein